MRSKNSNTLPRILSIILTILLLGVSLDGSIFQGVSADELDQTRQEKEQKEKELTEQQKQLEAKKAEEGTLAGQYQSYAGQLEQAEKLLEEKIAAIAARQAELKKLEQEMQMRETELAAKQALIEQRIRSLYKKSYTPSIVTFFSNDKLSSLAEDYTYRTVILKEDKKTAIGLGEMILAIGKEREENETLKASLEKEKETLDLDVQKAKEQIAASQAQIAANRNTQLQLVQQLVGLQGALASLTQKEQEILAAKAAAAAAQNTVGNNEQTWLSISTPAPGNSGNYFSFWTYGYPHRVGMNQYGAYGRALAGQTTGEILHAYYNAVTVTGIDPDAGSFEEPTEIKVDGYGWISFPDYLKGIGEMPSSWPKEALKAQAIAPRTYALNYINYASYQNYDAYRNDPNARSICTDQRCQVYLGHPKEAAWQMAVDDSAGMVILSGGVPITAWYASTAGGATLSSQEVWGGYRSYVLGIVDTDSQGQAYDGPFWGDSPWFHKAWGDNPWLSKEQTVDLVNAALLPQSYNQNLPSAENGGFSAEKVVETLNTEGIQAVFDMQSISLEINAKQTVSMVVVSSNGNFTLDPQRFRFVFNLRSPGTDAIWTTKFDVETN